MGIKGGARLISFLAILRAFSGLSGLNPKDLDQRELRAMLSDTAATGKSMEERRWRRAEPERQSGKPGPTGRPDARMALRSGGNAKPNSASARANSASDKPG